MHVAKDVAVVLNVMLTILKVWGGGVHFFLLQKVF